MIYRVFDPKGYDGIFEWPRKAAATALALMLASAVLPTPAAGRPAPPEKPDFTNLSLEELLNIDITPINVLGSHTHLSGEFMVGYRYSFQRFAGDLDGTREVGAAEVLAHYPYYHTFMNQQMHMTEVMYAPNDRLTLMGMGQFMKMDMGHQLANGSTFNTHSEGVGDTELVAIYNLLGNPHRLGHRLMLSAGLSLPTGSVDERYFGKVLEYEMQTGSGTFDVLPGVTYIGSTESWSWGAQLAGVIHTGSNDHDYRVGDMYRIGAWGHYKISDWVGPLLRMEWKQWATIHGSDPNLVASVNPASDARLQAGQRLDVLAGVQFYVPEGTFKGLRLGLEGGAPAYQSLAGPNLKMDWLLSFNLSFSF